jgi:hypothetical protein
MGQRCLKSQNFSPCLEIGGNTGNTGTADCKPASTHAFSVPGIRVVLFPALLQREQLDLILCVGEAPSLAVLKSDFLRM